MLAGKRQAPAPPKNPHQYSHPADELIWAPEAQELALPQMIEGCDWRTSLHARTDSHTAGMRRGKSR